MINIGILKRHIGNGETIKIGDDEILIKPLGTQYLPEFFKAMKSFSGAKEGASTEDVLKNIDDEGLNAIRVLIDQTLKTSLPDEPDDDIKIFGMKYMNILLPVIFEINSAPDLQTHENIKKKETLDRIKTQIKS